MSSLRNIFQRHGTDKWRHGYHAFYETLPTPVSMLEVGVHKGASLRAWAEWWPDAFIHGMDTFTRCPPPTREHPRGDIWTGDSRSYSLPPAFGGRMDLIIDDGSHKPRDQAATLRNLWPLLAPGGVYVIEDVVPVDLLGEDHLPEWFRRKPQQGHFTMAAFLELACAVSATGAPWQRHDYRHLSGKPDSVLIVLRKP